MIRFLLPLLLLATLAWWFGLQSAAQTLARASPSGLAGYGALTALVIVGYALRWGMVARTMGGHPPLIRLVAARLAGDAVGSIVPSARLAGEPVRVALARSPGNSTALSTAGVAVDRLLEVIGNMLAVIVYVTIFVTTRSTAQAGHAPAALGALMLLLLVGVGAMLYRLRRGARPLAPLYGARARAVAPRLAAWMDGLRQVEDHLIDFMRQHRRAFILGVLGSLVIEALCVAQYHALLAAFGIALDLPTLVLVLLGSGAARAVPAPAGLGVLEAAQVAVVAAAAGRPDVGFVVGVIVRLHETLLLGVGLLVLSYQGMSWARLRAAVRAGA
jgi:uncharacterized protein (TIRG00374 family)